MKKVDHARPFQGAGHSVRKIIGTSYMRVHGMRMVWYGILEFITSHSTQYRSFRRRGPEQRCTSPIQWRASDIITPLTRVAFVYNGPKGMELAPNVPTL